MRGRRRGEERQPRWRRIGGEGADAVEPADLERAEALAQSRLERSLPPRLDPDSGPQADKRFEPVLGEPGLELVLDLDFLLQRLQRRQPRTELGVAPALVVDRILQRASRLFERRDARLPVGDGGERGRMLGLGFAGGAPRRVELGRLDLGQALFLVAQALAARFGLLLALLDAARLGGQDLNLLLHRRDRIALLVAARLRRAQGVLAPGETRSMRGEIDGDRFCATLGRLDVTAEPLVLGARFAFANPPGGTLRFEVGALAQQPLAAGGDVADPLLEPADLERAPASWPCAAWSASLAS
jgi:hypothetical protein